MPNKNTYIFVCLTRTVDIQVVLPYSIGHCRLFDFAGDHQNQMLLEWVGLAVNDDIFMTVAILLSTCRYILHARPGDPFFTRMVLCYQQISLRSLRLEIESTPTCINAMSVAKALALAIDEVRLLNIVCIRYVICRNK